jgi:hypothetical protein
MAEYVVGFLGPRACHGQDTAAGTPGGTYSRWCCHCVEAVGGHRERRLKARTAVRIERGSDARKMSKCTVAEETREAEGELGCGGPTRIRTRSERGVKMQGVDEGGVVFSSNGCASPLSPN